MTTSPHTGSALRDIAIERLRQQESEGFTTILDDQNVDGELARASACYAIPAGFRRFHPLIDVPLGWPWRGYWKPTPDDRRRELVKAGALIVAEIERLDRAKLREGAA